MSLDRPTLTSILAALFPLLLIDVGMRTNALIV